MKPIPSGLTHEKCATRYSLDGVFPALEYKSVVKKAIHQFKYEPYISGLADTFARLMHENYIQNEPLMRVLGTSENVWIACVPLHSARMRKRGYNHSALLGARIAEKLGYPFSPDMLTRIRHTRPQFELKKDERAKNVAGAFQLSPRYRKKIGEKTVVIVDDVMTTGSTLRECGKLLKKSGVKKVYALTLAMES